jgi:hypothetical protein
MTYISRTMHLVHIGSPTYPVYNVHIFASQIQPPRNSPWRASKSPRVVGNPGDFLTGNFGDNSNIEQYLRNREELFTQFERNYSHTERNYRNSSHTERNYRNRREELFEAIPIISSNYLGDSRGYRRSSEGPRASRNMPFLALRGISVFLECVPRCSDTRKAREKRRNATRGFLAGNLETNWNGGTRWIILGSMIRK